MLMRIKEKKWLLSICLLWMGLALPSWVFANEACITRDFESAQCQSIIEKAESLRKKFQAREDCTDGRPYTARCEKMLKQTESELKTVIEKYERIGRKSLNDTYSDDDPDYVKDFSNRLHEAQIAWVKYREAVCAFSPLEDGMTRRYSYSMEEFCKVDMTKTRILHFKRKMKVF